MAESQTRTKAVIEAEIAAARERLAKNVEGLINQVHPKAVVQRGIDDARAYAAAEYASAKAQVFDSEGRLRMGRVAVIAGAILGSVTFLVVLRAIVKAARS